MRYPFILLFLLLGTFQAHAEPSLLDKTGGLLNSQDEFLPVEEAYQLTIVPTEDGLQLHWRISDGYFLYLHGFKAGIEGQDLTDTAITPAGIKKEDDLFGEVEVYYQQMKVVLPVETEGPFILDVQSQGCSEDGLCYPPYKQSFRVDWPGGGWEEVEPGQPTGGPDVDIAPEASAPITLPLAALFAFLGGLILNLMPCVLPVLSLKALGLASSHDSASKRIAHGWWYTAGIVGSFCLVAGVLIALQSAGSAVGWGFQLQSSWFVAALVYLFFLMALLLAGAADFSGQWMGFGQSLASGGGYRGSFFTGALAVLVASPCTAPFMGTAMGFALSQSPATAMLVFVALGLGMAAPFLLLSYLPQLGSWLPKPGAWMERFREFLAFPLLATAIWLLWVIARQTGADGVAFVLVGCLLIALALWFNGGAAITRFARLALFIMAIALLASPALRTTEMAPQQAQQDRFSEQRVAELRAEGTPVFVNFTADWCITCLANERWVLSKEVVAEAFEHNGVAYLKADWTNYDPVISSTLESWGRSGIPLYLYYPANPAGDVTILPQILSVELVLKTLSGSQKGES